MSKIIKEGKLPVKRMTCDYCGCEFEFSLKDCIDRPFANFSPVMVDCPNCHTTLDAANNRDELRRNSDFMEDVEALAKQYGIEIEELKIKE